MSVFWIIINFADLQYLLIIRFVGIKYKLFSKIEFIFHCKTAIVNPIAKAKFFNIICDMVFISLFAENKIKKELLGPILNYFAIIKTKNCGIFYLYCFI